MDLAKVYDEILCDIGISASYCCLYDQAEIIYRAGIDVNYSLKGTIISIVQNEALRDNFDFALSEIEKWESSHPTFPYLMWWKAIILQIVGKTYEAHGYTYNIRQEDDRQEMADNLTLILDNLERY